MAATNPGRKVGSPEPLNVGHLLTESVHSFATPETLGRFVALLISDAAGGCGFLTGSDVVMDGGV